MFRVALFGAGRIGQVHAKNISEHPLSELVSVTDIFYDTAKSLADKYDAEVREASDVFNDKIIDAILIGSSTDTHAELIELAAKSGKFIFCEKPVDLSLERVRECLKVVEENNATLMLGFNRRFDPQFSKVQEMYAAGAIGKAELINITSRDPAAPPVSYIKVSGGLFRDMSIHDLDMACFITGEDPIAVTAAGTCVVDPEIGKAGDIDTAVITLEFPSGCLATINNSRRTTYGYDQRLEIHGEKGMLQVNNILEHQVVTTTNKGPTGAKPQFFFLERYEQAYRAEWSHFIDAIAGNTTLSTTGKDGERSLAIADAALKAMQTGQRQKLTW